MCPEIETLGVPELHCLGSLTTGDDTVRVVYVAKEIWDIINPPYAESAEGEMHAEFRQMLDAFLEGGEFSVAEDPFSKASDAMIARIDPVNAELWDFRVIHPCPGIRALGGFWCLDTFVVLTWDYRENFDERWNVEVERCLRRWREMFGSRSPLKGNTLDDYLTNFYPV
jgi:hypothetical protein